MTIAQECQPITEKQLPSFSKMDGASNQSPKLSRRQILSNGSLYPLPSCSRLPFLFLFLLVSRSLQHLELVIEAVDSAEAELPGLLVLVVEAVETERGGDAVALRGKRG